jgi:hypothetical protein
MSNRISQSHVAAKVRIVNGLLGFDADAVTWNTVGAVELYSAYGAYAVHRTANEHGGESDLSTLGTLREADKFLSGMIAALRITQEF